MLGAGSQKRQWNTHGTVGRLCRGCFFYIICIGIPRSRALPEEEKTGAQLVNNLKTRKTYGTQRKRKFNIGAENRGQGIARERRRKYSSDGV